MGLKQLDLLDLKNEREIIDGTIATVIPERLNKKKTSTNNANAK